MHSSIANNFNPLLFTPVNDSFPLKFTNGHKRCVTPLCSSFSCPPTPPCSTFVLYAVISAWNVISRNVGGVTGITRAAFQKMREREWKHECLRSSFFISRRVLLHLWSWSRRNFLGRRGRETSGWQFICDRSSMMSPRFRRWRIFDCDLDVRRNFLGKGGKKRQHVYLYPILDGGN